MNFTKDVYDILASEQKPEEYMVKKYTYGTAGFRAEHHVLASTFLRMGVMSTLRSRAAESLSVGIMITASHNPEIDNGIKIVDPSGYMLSQSWEPRCELFANASTVDEMSQIITKIIEEDNIDLSKHAVVFIGRDTRPHSAHLSSLAKKGAEAAGALVHDLGEVTTPQLHFVVQNANKDAENQSAKVSVGSDSIFNILRMIDTAAALQGYHKTLLQGYFDLCKSAEDDRSALTDSVVIDCSRGIGSVALTNMARVANEIKPDYLKFDLRNEVNSGPVNDGCGAELVQKSQIAPQGVNLDTDVDKLLCSFDGDADRIVFHAFLSVETETETDNFPHSKRRKAETGEHGYNSSWVLFDGDKIAALVSILIAQELRAADLMSKFTMGVVQTAYANGASTAYLREHGYPS